ncbi:alpha/beta fold hydrolase [Actinoplanes sp. N902-109]|uniref:alpha/beta fold hydrolase n=1 Tax=Actinoplanes sp. (strain N902-109) TaxID=649831 RepID=UPI000329383C|nr:hypothetical protein [Actinoplanes sp. N902-109]AGL16106.1 hypothetical protein L083_2596 [Actinoplanes sp. N902-109]
MRFADYSGLFRRAGSQGAPAGLDEEQSAILAELLRETVNQHLADDQPDTTRRSLERVRAALDPPGESQGMFGIVRRVTAAVTALLSVPPLRRGGQWLAPKVMIGDLAQVARYLARSEKDADGATLDERIRARVRAELTGQPSVVVAHSLGSVVAFELLAEHTGEIPLLVTIGSPIALRTVVLPRLRPHPPHTPECVRRWLNFWDRDDVITARPILADAVAPNGAGVAPNSRRVDSDGLWVHTATKYLQHGEVAGPIVEGLA